MITILLKALALVVIITIGYALKKAGFFKPTDQNVVASIVMNITFPAAIITNFSSFHLDHSYLLVILFGFAVNFLLVAITNLMTRRHSEKTRGLFLLSVSGYNIGLFSMPFIQNFVGPIGTGIVILFDIGNSTMVTGGSYALSSRLLHKGDSNGFKSIIKILKSSAPFITYLSMTIIELMKIEIPEQLTLFTAPIGSANPFLAMLMVGLMLEINLKASSIRTVSKIIMFRLMGSTILALCFYFLLPFPFIVRQALVLVMFSPISGLTPIFTQKIGSDQSLASLLASLTVLISLVIITTLVMVMKIGY